MTFLTEGQVFEFCFDLRNKEQETRWVALDKRIFF